MEKLGLWDEVGHLRYCIVWTGWGMENMTKAEEIRTRHKKHSPGPLNEKALKWQTSVTMSWALGDICTSWTSWGQRQQEDACTGCTHREHGLVEHLILEETSSMAQQTWHGRSQNRSSGGAQQIHLSIMQLALGRQSTYGLEQDAVQGVHTLVHASVTGHIL